MNAEQVSISLPKRILGWIKQLALWLLIVLVLTSVMDIWRGKDIPRDNLPPLQGMTLTGVEVDIAKLSQDQAVLVYFWGTWCPVCNYVSPAVSQMSAYYPVVTVAMSSGEDDKLRKYLQHQGYGFDTINDSDSKIARDWSLQATPTIMIVKEGELKHYTTGFTSLPGMWWRMLLA
ncbi:MULTISPECIES: protein disulfide oxidoreductase [Shewanella]|uniref:Alkyl hydroperoxide reductase/ Thiol specific antioxidant/ Mal allergen n=3 Tax=Shewanella putrefaciens TaxID=24 RepID=E6XJE0_SHEP2|nr:MULTISPECIES: protein disulfide oxidoreductase [Shewanella]CAD6365939.1 Thiol-disulfide oxidoreductase ResA [Shewanella hafniensis]ABM26760.1 Redoxin domain protein [Shewanella sp. W3-18-1]AVV84662.1 redoxin redoxin domain-containing protein [Shewanella putrefaciens]MCA1896929.1 protein disulfide oxidoreductase [Shewanella putrefaciens]MCK7631021.1 protein disulfide oxidoreductase [Shewanella sp. JNE9-1]